MNEHPNARTDPAAYARYLAGMDASMRQKVALTAAHLRARGRVADMGTGSGAGALALASLYPELQVVGVDLDPEIVALARRKHSLPNLTFEVGDVAARVFEDGSLQAILDSSVLHHVTSFSGYDHAAAGRALAVQARALATHGTLIVRDFLAPDARDEIVHLDLPANDGDDGDDPRTASSAALLRRFAREFRCLSAMPGFALRDLGPAPRPGWHRFALALGHAVEFVLRKDYRRDWESEVREEYTYFDQGQFESLFAHLGLRVLASTPLYNPWILRNRFEGRFTISSTETGSPQPTPPTNYVIVGEKVPDGEGVRFSDAGEAEPIGYLHFECHRDTNTGLIRDLVSRPNPTLDLLPWFREGDDVFVFARTSYPRPLLASEPALGPSPCGARAPHYLAEPLSVIQPDAEPWTDCVAKALSGAGFVAADDDALWPGTPHYPSPGGTLEEVRPIAVRVAPVLESQPLRGLTEFSTSGHLRAIEARQLLRAAAVGGLPDTRLELQTHTLLRRLGLDPGPWIGEAISLADHDRLPPGATSSLVGADRQRFAPAFASASPGFLQRRSRLFREHAADGRVLVQSIREGVFPARHSLFTVSAAALWRVGEEVYFGIDDDDLPAAQRFTDSSQLWVVPAWRLPVGRWTRESMLAFVRERLMLEYGVSVTRAFELGGRYHPSAGLSAEVVYPWAFDVERVEEGPRRLAFCPVQHLISNPDLQRDGHLRTSAARVAHALGHWHTQKPEPTRW